MDLKGKPHISEPYCFKNGMLKDKGSASITQPLAAEDVHRRAACKFVLGVVPLIRAASNIRN
jgi:hypothetical protein